MNPPDSEEMILDFPSWLGRQDETTRSTIQGSLDLIDDPARRAAMQQRLAGQFTIAAAYPGIDRAALNDQWGTYRGGYAETRGGEWAAVKDDEAGFHSLMVKEATQRRDERYLLQGLDDPAAPGARDTFGASLLFHAQNAAYKGKSMAEALGDWQKLAEGKPGYDPERLAQYEDFTLRAHSAVAQDVAAVKPVAQQIYNELARERGLQSGEAGASPAELLRGKTPEQKQLAFRMVRDIADNGLHGAKGEAQAFMEAVGRSFENLGVGASTAYQRNVLLRTKFEAGQRVMSGLGPVDQAKAMDNAKDEWSAGDAANALPGLRDKLTHVLTAEEAADWNQKLVAAREDLDTAEQWRKFGQEVVDPTQIGGAFFRKVVLPAADSTALMAAMWIPGATAAALSLTSQSYQNDEYTRLRGLGMKPEEANRVAAVTGLAQAALDKAEFAALGNKLPGVKNVLERFALRGSTLARLGANIGTTLAAETGIELVQDQIVPALMQDVMTSDPAFDVKWGDVWSDVAKATPDTMMGMVLLSGLGGAHQTHGETQYVKQFSADAAAMRARGYSMEQIGQIQAAPNVEQKGALLAEFLPTKAPEGAEKAELVKDVVRLKSQQAAVFDEKARVEAISAGEAADYAIRVVRGGDGWRVETAGGKSVQVSSADAAAKIRDDFKTALARGEAEAFVAVLDKWHDSAPDGVKREETAVSGERVDATGLRIRETGELRWKEMDAKKLAALHQEAAALGLDPEKAMVNGENVVTWGEGVADGVRHLVQRLEINQSESAIATAVHETFEADAQAALMSGRVTHADISTAIQGLAPSLDPLKAKDAEEKAFRERVQRVASGRAGPDESRETLTELAVADAFGKRKDGAAFPAGSMTAGLDAMIRTEVGEDALERLRGLQRVRAFIAAVKAKLRAIFGTVAALKKARRDGGAEKFDALIAKITGTDEQAKFDREMQDERAALLDSAGLDYQPPSAEDEAAGIAFSLNKKTPKQKEAERLAALRATRAKFAAELGAAPDAAAKIGGKLLSAYDALTARTGFPAIAISELARESGEPLEDVKAQVLAAHKAGAAVLSTGDWSLSGEEARAGMIEVGGQKMLQVRLLNPEEAVTAYRLSAGSRYEAMQRAVDTALAKDPNARRRLARSANEKLQRFQFNSETMRLTGRGDEVRPLVEKRTTAELNKEQGVRQAVRTDELTEQGMNGLTAATRLDYERGSARLEEGPLAQALLYNHGRLVSLTEALRRGWEADEYDDAPWIPPHWYGGTITPDEAAQMLHEDGLLKEPTPAALWKALGAEVAVGQKANAKFVEASKIVAEIERQARNTAREEAAEWRRQQDEMQARDWSPRSALVRDLRTLEALASVLPPELRGKLGGSVKLAQLGSDTARLKEINARIAKMGRLVEEYLKKESTEALDKLIEKAQPDREAGKQSRGKLGAETHRYFDAVDVVRGLTTEQVGGERAKLAAEYANPSLTPEQAADIFEREQILDTFGAWKEKSAAEMDAATQKAEAVYRDGRNFWREKEESRLADVKAMADEVVKSLGGASDAEILKKQKAAKTLNSMAKGVALDLKSFTEVLDALLGEDHPLARKWSRDVREGFARKNDELRDFRKRWKAALESATGERGVKARRILWDMGQNQSVTVEKAGEAKTSTLEVPISVIDSWATGADPAALGISATEAAQLTAERAGMDPGDRRQKLDLHRESRALSGPVSMTEAQGIFLTMLGAQEQYQAGLDKAGYDASTLASIEAKLSKPAKALRDFMRTEYRDGYAPLAAVFENMFGVALPQITNYAPASFYHSGAEKAMDPHGGDTIEGGFRAGFLKNRKQHTAAPRLENAFATFFGHANQTAHWKSMAEFVREFSGVMGKPEVKRAIESKHGEPMLRAVSSWQRAIEGNGLQQEAGALDKMVRWITGAQVHIALAYNLGTILKQSSAILGAAYRIPLGAYARGFAKLVTGHLEAGAMFRSEVIQRRLESGFAPEVRAAMNDIWNAKPTRRADLIERGTEFIGLVDAFFTTGSAAIAYDYHRQQAEASGLTGEAAHMAAMREVAEVVERTAQPADVPSRSLFENRQNQFGRLLFMFASEARQKSSLALNAWGNVVTGKATKADARVLLISHLIVGPMIQAITAAWRDARDDDDEEIFDAEHWNPMDFLKAIVAGPLSGLPLLGDLLSGFKNDGILGRFVNAGHSAKQLFDGPTEHESEGVEWYVKKIVQVMQGMSAEIGVAGRVAGQVFQVADNFAPDSEDEAAKKERAARGREQKQRREERKRD